MLTDLLEGMSRFGGELLSWLLWMNVWTAAILVLVVIVDRLFAARISAGWRMALYAVIALRLVMPVQWDSPLGVPEHSDHASMLGTSVDSNATASMAMPNAASAADLAARDAGVAIDAGLIAAAIVYVCIVCGLLARWVAARRRAAMSLAGSTHAHLALQELGGAYPVLIHERLGPLALGIFNPRIVLPRRLVESMDRSSLEWIVRHEAAHLRRHDQILLAAVQLLCIAAWPVAAMWLAARRVRDLIEIACDEAVLRTADDHSRWAYGRTLLDVAERLAPSRLAAPIGVQWGNSVVQRIGCLARRRRWPRAIQTAVIPALVIGLAACSTTTRHRDAAAPTRDEPVIVAPAAAVNSDAAVIRVELRVCAISDTLMERLPSTAEDTPMATLSTESFEKFMTALHDDEESSILSAPALMTYEGREATMTIGDAEGERLMFGVLPVLEGDAVLMQVNYDENFSDQPHIAGSWSILADASVVTLLVFPQPEGIPHRVVAVTTSVVEPTP